MHYSKLIKTLQMQGSMTVPKVEPVVTTHTRTSDEVDQLMAYFDHLETNYFQNMPYSKNLAKELIWDITDDLYKYVTKLLLLDPPITCQPLTMLYGQCLTDLDAYPNFIKALVEYNIENEDYMVDYIKKNSQILDDEQGDE